MSQNYKLSVEIDAQNKKLLRNMQGSSRAVQDFTQSVAAISPTSQRANRAVNTLGNTTARSFTQSVASGERLIGCLSRISQIATASLTIAPIAGVASAMRDELGMIQDQDVRLQHLTRTTTRYQQARTYLSSLAKDHSASLHTLSNSYARLLALENARLITGNQSRSMLEGLSNASKALGTSNAQLNQVMYGLAQGLSAGTLRAEELNQVTEPMPGLLQELDKAAGVAAGGFRRLVVDGKVTSAMFAQTMVKALAAYDGAAARTANTVNAKSTNMKNAWTATVRAFEQPLNIAVGGTFDAATASLEQLANNAETVISVLEVGMVAAIGRASGALASYSVAKVNAIRLSKQQAAAEQARSVIAIKAQQSEATARLAKARAEVVAAAAEERSALLRKQSALGSASAISAENALMAAKARGAAASQMAMVAERQLATSRIALTAATQGATIASRALSVTMGLLGGPVGVVMLAATAIGYWATKSKNAAEDGKALSNQVSTLSENYATMSFEARKAAIAQEKHSQALISKQLTEAKAQLVELEKSYQQIARGPAGQMLWEKQHNELRQLISSLESDLTSSSNKVSKIFDAGLNNIRWKSPEIDSAEASEAAAKLLAQLNSQIALLGETRHAAKLRYQLEHGELRKLTQAQKDDLIERAERLDKMEAEAAAARELAIAREALRAQTVNIGTAANDAVMTPEQRELAQFESNMTKLQDYRSYLHQWEYTEQARVNAAIEAEQARHHQALDTLEKQRGQMAQQVMASSVNNLTGMLMSSMEEQSAAYKAMFLLQRSVAVAMTIVNANTSAEAIRAREAPVMGMGANAAAELVRALGYASAGVIAGTALAGIAHDGISRVPAANEGTWLLRRDEMVLNPAQADNFEYLRRHIQQQQQTAHQSGAASGAAPIINIIGAPAGTTTRQRQSADGQWNVDVLIAAAVDAAEQRISRQITTGTGSVGRAVRGRAA